MNQKDRETFTTINQIELGRNNQEGEVTTTTISTIFPSSETSPKFLALRCESQRRLLDCDAKWRRPHAVCRSGYLICQTARLRCRKGSSSSFAQELNSNSTPSRRPQFAVTQIEQCDCFLRREITRSSADDRPIECESKALLAAGLKRRNEICGGYDRIRLLGGPEIICDIPRSPDAQQHVFEIKRILSKVPLAANVLDVTERSLTERPHRVSAETTLLHHHLAS